MIRSEDPRFLLDGESEAPYVESDLVRPLSIYGKSKWWGEQATRERKPDELRTLAYDDAFAGGSAAFLRMLDPRLRLIRELLAPRDELCAWSASRTAEPPRKNSSAAAPATRRTFCETRGKNQVAASAPSCRMLSE